MNIEQSTKRIGEVGIVPVLRAPNAHDARQAVAAIFAGGISIVEITMTIPDAPAVIRSVVEEYGEQLLIGAGTVITREQAAACLDAGAQFLVSPGLCPPVLAAARERGKLAIPGALTPTELIAANLEGAHLVKIFPCDNVGGPKYIKALKGPFPNSKLIPTGGVSLGNVADYFAAGCFAVGTGSDLVDHKLLRAGRAGEITAAARRLVEIVEASRLPGSP